MKTQVRGITARTTRYNRRIQHQIKCLFQMTSLSDELSTLSGHIKKVEQSGEADSAILTWFAEGGMKNLEAKMRVLLFEKSATPAELFLRYNRIATLRTVLQVFSNTHYAPEIYEVSDDPKQVILTPAGKPGIVFELGEPTSCTDDAWSIGGTCEAPTFFKFRGAPVVGSSETTTWSPWYWVLVVIAIILLVVLIWFLVGINRVPTVLVSETT